MTCQDMAGTNNYFDQNSLSEIVKTKTTMGRHDYGRDKRNLSKVHTTMGCARNCPNSKMGKHERKKQDPNTRILRRFQRRVCRCHIHAHT